ncbi:MAG: AMP-binding protein [Lautropia sp.]|nr:AMP-binding protein [Lautropia sp.]
MPLPLPASREEIRRIQSQRKRVALAQARRAPFYHGRLDDVDPDRLDDPDEWAKIPVLDKEVLRSLTDEQFYRSFCLHSEAGLAEYWRSGGATGQPLFYPRSHEDLKYAMVSFARIFECVGLRAGDRVHDSFPLGIHPVGHMLARAAQAQGIGVNWAGAGTTTPSQLQVDLIRRLAPTAWMGMSSYGLHLANLAESLGVGLAAGSVRTIVCSAEPLSDAKREKLERSWGARVRDTFGMTEAGMMGAEDETLSGFRVWTDMYFLEVVDPQTHEPVAQGEVGALVVTPLWTNDCTPFLRWLSGDLVTMREADDGGGPYSVFPLVRHAHRTTGFFKVRGVNINHPEFEDFMFRDAAINDFKCELLAAGGNDVVRVSIEIKRDAKPGDVVAALEKRVKHTFELTPEVVVLEAGTLAHEFESSVKAPRFADRR